MDGARQRDRARTAAYNAGKAGQPMPFEGEDDELLDLYNQGQNDREGASSSPSSKSSKSNGGGGIAFDDAGEEAGALLLGLLAYALLISYIRGGWPGVTAWLRAKFLNQTSSTSSSSSSSPGTIGQNLQKGVNDAAGALPKALSK